VNFFSFLRICPLQSAARFSTLVAVGVNVSSC
jgi:hypothetical protein